MEHGRYFLVPSVFGLVVLRRLDPRFQLRPPTSALAVADPLEIFREGLALFRRAGLSWFDAKDPAWDAALSVVPDETERDEWSNALYATRSAWMRAYERRSPSGNDLRVGRV
jgi:hypothetical protein